MKGKNYEIGECVRVKDTALSGELVFIWGEACIDNEEWLIINLPLKTIKEFGFKRINKIVEYKLFSNFDYCLVKHYKLLKADTSQLEDYNLLRWIIANREFYNTIAEFIFLFLLECHKDKINIEEIIFNSFLPKVINDEASVLLKEDVRIFNSNKVNFRLKMILIPIFFKATAFRLIKRMKNFSEVAKRIITDDNRSLLLRMKDDKDMLDSLLSLFNKKGDYPTVTHSPMDSKKDRPISYKLSKSFLGVFQKDISKYSKLMEEKQLFIRNHTKSL